MQIKLCVIGGAMPVVKVLTLYLKANNKMISIYNDRLLPVEWLENNQSQARSIESDIYYIILNAENKEEQNKK